MWMHLKHCPVVLNGFKLKISQTYKKQPKSILNVGRFIKLKRPMDAASALSQINSDEPIFYWIGEGELKNVVEASVFWDKRFRFLSKLSREDTQRFMAKSSILLSTSSIEGLPISVLEGAGHGCILILSNIPPHREIAQFIPNTLLFDNQEELLNNLHLVLSLSQEALNKKYRENKIASKQNFDMDRVFSEYEKIYNNLE